MNERIARLIDEAKQKDIFPKRVAVAYNPLDEQLPEPMRIAKRLGEYMAAQPPGLGPDDTFIGRMRFDGSVPADIFTRTGHTQFFRHALDPYYNKPLENLCTLEWQHSNMDFRQILADVFQADIETISVTNSAGLGAAQPPVATEVKAALSGEKARLFSFVGGLAGRDISDHSFRDIFAQLMAVSEGRTDRVNTWFDLKGDPMALREVEI